MRDYSKEITLCKDLLKSVKRNKKANYHCGSWRLNKVKCILSDFVSKKFENEWDDNVKLSYATRISRLTGVRTKWVHEFVSVIDDYEDDGVISKDDAITVLKNEIKTLGNI